MRWTQRQMEFRDRLNRLLEEYVDAVGPQFSGDGVESIELGNPVLDCWLLGTRWEDLDDQTGGGAVVRLDSGVGGLAAYGLAHTLVDMIRES